MATDVFAKVGLARSPFHGIKRMVKTRQAE